MKISGQFFLYLLILIVVTSCNKDKDGFSRTESGLLYKFIKSNAGPKPELGDIMEMDIIYLTDTDSILFDSKAKSDSFTVEKVDPTFIGGVEEGFAMMSVGDSALFKASADSIFEKTFHSTLPGYLTPGRFITFKVKLKNIIPKSVHDSLKIARDVASRREEFERIELFLQQNEMDVMPTKNGVYMATSKSGTGEFPAKGDTVYVNYTARLLDGTIFDQAVNTDPPFSFVVGNGMVIEGWEECIPFLNKGSVARLVIPSDLAFGDQQKGVVKPYSTLVFDVEILDVKKGGNNPQ